MDANKQVHLLISYHSEQAEFHKKKADLLRAYLSNTPTEATIVAEKPKKTYADVISDEFSTKWSKKRQALFLIRKEGKIKTMKEWQAIYDSIVPKGGDITMTIRLLKLDNTGAKKEYGRNVVKWGLYDWFDQSKDDFKNEYK